MDPKVGRKVAPGLFALCVCVYCVRKRHKGKLTTKSCSPSDFAGNESHDTGRFRQARTKIDKLHGTRAAIILAVTSAIRQDSKKNIIERSSTK